MSETSLPYFRLLLKEIEASETTFQSIYSVAKGTSLTAEILEKKRNKQELASTVIRVLAQMKKNIDVMKQVFEDIEATRNDEKKATIAVMKLQKELLDCKTEQINDFQEIIGEKLQTTLKTEMKSYSDAVQANNDINRYEPSVTINDIGKTVRTAVKTAKQEIERGKNLVVFGLAENENEDITEAIKEMLLELSQKPKLEKVTRFGTKSLSHRPVRLTLDSPTSVHDILRVSKKLKVTEKYRDVYITIDRTVEQQTAHRKLVEQLRRNITESPHRRFYIRGGKVHCEENKLEISNKSVSVQSIPEEFLKRRANETSYKK